jgi:hypothetical protein
LFRVHFGIRAVDFKDQVFYQWHEPMFWNQLNDFKTFFYEIPSFFAPIWNDAEIEFFKLEFTHCCCSFRFSAKKTFCLPINCVISAVK